jgi:hypothetical protein
MVEYNSCSFFVFFEKEVKTLTLCIKEMHTAFIYILFNKNLAGAYVNKSEATTQYLQTRQWVKNMSSWPYGLKTEMTPHHLGNGGASPNHPMMTEDHTSGSATL